MLNTPPTLSVCMDNVCSLVQMVKTFIESPRFARACNTIEALALKLETRLSSIDDKINAIHAILSKRFPLSHVNNKVREGQLIHGPSTRQTGARTSTANKMTMTGGTGGLELKGVGPCDGKERAAARLPESKKSARHLVYKSFPVAAVPEHLGFKYDHAVVTEIAENPEALQRGVQRGWTIVAIEGYAVQTDDAIQRAIHQVSESKSISTFTITFEAANTKAMSHLYCEVPGDETREGVWTYKIFDAAQYSSIALRSKPDVSSPWVRSNENKHVVVAKGTTWLVRERLQSLTDGNVYLKVVTPEQVEGWVFAYDFDNLTKKAIVRKLLCVPVVPPLSPQPPTSDTCDGKEDTKQNDDATHAIPDTPPVNQCETQDTLHDIKEANVFVPRTVTETKDDSKSDSSDLTCSTHSSFSTIVDGEEETEEQTHSMQSSSVWMETDLISTLRASLHT